MSCQLFDLDALHAGKYFVLFCCLLIFFKIIFFKTSLQENYQSVKMVWVQIRTDICGS